MADRIAPNPFFAEAEAAPSPERGGEYVVVARRYRPQSFAELVGQEPIAKALSGAIATHRVGHAYLFTGARGVGKTSAARILAKCLNCVNGPTETPCNQCDSCLSIAVGEDVDVLEIDGASNRGIEEMRELRHNVGIRPSRSRFKVYIIDEVHMLTREAFNALLKTLEEPPEHVKFIFCTTEVEKIPITILSRCQRFDFAGIQPAMIVERLRQIVAAEGVEAEPEALQMLARRAGGSMRDSQSLLEQLLSLGGKTLRAEDVNQMLGTASDQRLNKLVTSLARRDAAGALAELDDAISGGVDVGQLLEQLLVYYRDLMVAAIGGREDILLHFDKETQQIIRSTATQLGLPTILASMQLIDATVARLRYSTQARVLAELVVVRLCQLADLEELPRLIDQLRGGAATATIAPRGTPTATPPPTPKKKAEHDSPVSVPAQGHGAAGELIALAQENAEAIWKLAVERLTGFLADNAAQAQQWKVQPPHFLVATFPRKYNSCKAYCEQSDQLARLQQALSELTGQAITVKFALAEEESGSNGTSAPQRHVPQRDRLREKASHPLVRKAMELFDARPVRVDGPSNG